MSKTLAIAGRELRGYFSSPMAYVMAAVFMAIAGLFFALILNQTKQASLSMLFSNIAVCFLLITPASTMRLLAEERKTGTIELLMTSPVTDRDVVFGKYLASVLFLAFLIALMLVYPVILVALGGKPDWWPMWTGFLGTFLLGSAFMAIGVFASSITQNVVIAAVVTFAISLLMWLVPNAGSIFGGPVNDVMSYLSIISHQEQLSRGVIDTSDVLYYLSFIAAFLFLTIRSVETYHWR